MARARTERVNQALYFIDHIGRRWRVHDCYIGAFGVALAAETATFGAPTHTPRSTSRRDR